jgi:hypothetical protein
MGGTARVSRRLALIGLAVLCAGLPGSAPPAPRSPAVEPSSGYDVTPRPIERLVPGTVVGDGPPPGWSHLVIKSVPRPGAGDTDRLTPSTRALASFIFTAFVAHVRPETVEGRTRYRLAHLAMGLGTAVKGRDTILSPDTQARLGARLGFLQRLVLSGAYGMQGEVQVVARSRGCAFVDAPTLLLRRGKHRSVTLRYALLVDDRTGHLDALLWLLDRQADPDAPASRVRLLPRNLIEDCVLHVDAHEFTLGVPTDRAFAAAELPPARAQLSFPDDLKAPAARPLLTPAEARRLEAGLRRLVDRKR